MSHRPARVGSATRGPLLEHAAWRHLQPAVSTWKAAPGLSLIPCHKDGAQILNQVMVPSAPGRSSVNSSSVKINLTRLPDQLVVVSGHHCASA